MITMSRSTWTVAIATLLLLALAPISRPSDNPASPPEKSAARKQLSIGYSLLYQEADGIPKLKWILMLKDKPEEMGRVTNQLLAYYQKLSGTMRELAKQYPAMRIDVPTMSEIEANTRKAIGEDLAKDLAPLVGKSGTKFEREVLLTFYDSLNEQRHLAGVMLPLETNVALKKFLEKTKMELEEHYAEIGALLDRRYFSH
jgi:hypothetical protein